MTDFPRVRAAAAAGVAATLLLSPLSASAAVTTSTFNVTATVATTCQATGSEMAFGFYAGSQVDGQSTITVICSLGTTYTLSLNAGNGVGATTSTRAMTKVGPALATAGPTELGYNLYSDSGRTLNWGNIVGTDTVAGTGTAAAQTFSVYGRIPGAQTSNSGAFADIITITLTF